MPSDGEREMMANRREVIASLAIVLVLAEHIIR
jgi:hypothetical protein